MITLSSTYFGSQYFLSRILLVKKFLLPHLAPVSMDLKPSFLYFILKFCYSAFLYFNWSLIAMLFCACPMSLEREGHKKSLGGEEALYWSFVITFFCTLYWSCIIVLFCACRIFLGREGHKKKLREKGSS